MKARRGIAVVLVAAMATLGVGCSPTPLSKNAQQGIGNFFFLAIYIALCQANYGNCPFPIAPTLPSPSPPQG